MGGFFWGLAGLLDTGTVFSNAMGEATASSRIAERFSELPAFVDASALDWNRADVIEAAIALSLLPDPASQVSRASENELRIGSSSAVYGGLPSITRLVRGQPVAEAPIWLVLSIAGGSLVARRHALRT
jgi:hypothetical protein